MNILDNTENEKTNHNFAMQEMMHEVPVVSRPERHISGLLGFLYKGEADAIFKQQPFRLQDETIDPLAAWKKSFEARNHLPPLPQAKIAQISGAEVDAIQKRTTYQRHYENVGDYQIAEINISSLLTPQWFVDLDYVNELGDKLKEKIDIAALLEFAMPEGTITEPIVRGNQVIFTSPRLDLSVNPIPEVRDGGNGEFEIVVRASSRPNYIQVADIQGRFLLTNGVHKVLALFRRGYSHTPCLLRQVHNLEEAGFNRQQTTLFADQNFGSGRPASILDFLEEAVAVPLMLRSTYQVMRVTVGSETLQVPALPNT